MFDINLWCRHLVALDAYTANRKNQDDADRLKLTQRRELVTRELQRVSRAEYLEELVGTLGADLLGEH